MKNVIPEMDHVLPLTPTVFHILLALTDQERHDYDIMQEVMTMTQNRVRLGPGTLYDSIKQSEHSDLANFQ